MKIMKRDSITGELDDLKRIVTSLRSGTDDQAAAILARLRLGETPEDVAKSLSLASSPAAAPQPPRYASLHHSLLPGCEKNMLVTGVQLTGPGVHRHLWKCNEP
jgi:ABC-type iron transport system FetAB permease component